MRKTALVTGASGGIGRAAALALAVDGFDIAVHYYENQAAAEDTAAQVRRAGAQAYVVRADVADSTQVRAMAEDICRVLGHIDVLVNNAGISAFGLLTEMDDQQWERLRGVNLDGVLFCCRAALPEMIRRHSGRIINVSSVWGRVGASCEAAYSACKAGVIGLTKALAKEVGPSGVTVNCVAPGVIDTQMNAHLDAESMRGLKEETPLERIGTPQEVAAAIRFFAGEQAAFLTGQVLGVDGGFQIG